MLRASCDRCHRDKVKCQFEPGISSCVRCQNRRGRCVRSAPLPPGRLKSSAKAARNRAAVASHPDNHYNSAIQHSPHHEKDTVFPGETLCGPLDESVAATQIHAVVDTAAPQTLVLGHHDNDGGSGWWESPTLLEPAMPPWHLGTDYSQPLSLFTELEDADPGVSSAFTSGESSEGGSSSSSARPTTSHEQLELPIGVEATVVDHKSSPSSLSSSTACRCSATLACFLENETHPCLSSDPSAFDVVLNTNRAVMGAVRGLAECWAAHPPGVVMVACLLLGSVLASVREASDACCRRPLRRQQQRSAAASSSSSPRDSLPGGGMGGGDGGPHQQVFIGSYGMDEEDSSVLRRQMVLLDLDKVKKTLCLLQDRIEREHDGEGIYLFVNKFLSAEVRRISRRLSEQEDG